MKHLNIKVFGLVQGIFYRVTAKEIAEKLNLKGFVRNEADGSVYIEAESEEKNLEEFLKWCKIGPNLAQVKDIKVSQGELKNFKEFKAY